MNLRRQNTGNTVLDERKAAELTDHNWSRMPYRRGGFFHGAWVVLREMGCAAAMFGVMLIYFAYTIDKGINKTKTKVSLIIWIVAVIARLLWVSLPLWVYRRKR